METNNFDEKLVAKIKQEKIAPKPRWHFLLKDYVIRITGTISLMIGAGAVSVMIYLFKYNGWEIQEKTNKSLWEFFLLTLPYFWIIFLGLFIFILYYNLKHTKSGYRYPLWFIIISSILASVILGSVFFLFGLGEKIDNILGEQAPFYNTVINRHLDFWFNPEEGRLTGIVSAENDDRNFEIIDPKGDTWQIIAGPQVLSTELIKLKEPVDLVGHVLDNSQFQADIIRPLRPGRGFLSRPHGRGNGPCRSGDCPIPSREFLPPPTAQ